MGGASAVVSDLIQLLPDDAPRLCELSRRFYPASFQQAADTVAANLCGAWNEVFSVGLEQAGELVGYLVAWKGDTYIAGRTETVMVIDDLVVDPGHRPSLFRLLAELKEMALEAELEGIPVEGFLREDAARLLASHAKLLARLGYEIVSAYRAYDDRVGEELVWMRFEALP